MKFLTDLSPLVAFIFLAFAIALAIAAVLLPFVVLMIDSRLAKTLKATQDAARTLALMESMMRNGR